MIHRTTSSKSSNGAIELNLLRNQDRASRVNVCKSVYPRPKQRASNPQPLYASYPANNYEQSEFPTFSPENYSTYAQGDGRLSRSLLSETWRNNRAIGMVLLLVAMGAAVAEVLSTRFLQHASTRCLIINLVGGEWLGLGVLWWLKELEKGSFKQEVWNNRRGKTLLTHPAVLISLVVACSCVWGYSYARCLFERQPAYFLLYYVFIFPEVTLYLTQDSTLWVHRFTILTFVLSLAVAWWQSIWFLLLAITGTYLSNASSKAFTTLYISYIGKTILLILAIFCLENDITGDYILWRPLVIVAIAGSVILTRFFLNKYLRTELYKYYYSDANINCIFLLEILSMGLLEGQLQVGVTITCIFFFLLCYKVGHDNIQIAIE